MRILYQDADLLVCVKPARVLSTDEPGGLPELVRQALGDPGADVRTVHRLDRVVSGLMVLARNGESASGLSRQIREGTFGKEYLAVVHGVPQEKSGELWDLLGRDKARRMTYVAEAPGKGIQQARLSYRVEAVRENLSLVRIRLHTGRTHQIRVHMAYIGHPILGDMVYGHKKPELGQSSQCLHAGALCFRHPRDGRPVMVFAELPPYFKDVIEKLEKMGT